MEHKALVLNSEGRTGDESKVRLLKLLKTESALMFQKIIKEDVQLVLFLSIFGVYLFGHCYIIRLYDMTK